MGNPKLIIKKIFDYISSINKKSENKNGREIKENKLINVNFLFSKSKDYLAIIEFHEFILHKSKFDKKRKIILRM